MKHLDRIEQIHTARNVVIIKIALGYCSCFSKQKEVWRSNIEHNKAMNNIYSLFT